MKYNIAIYNDQEFNVYIGGIERVSISMANQLLDKGFNIYLISICKSEYTIPYTTPVPIIFLPSEDTCCKPNVEKLREILVANNVDILINQSAHSLASHNLCQSARIGTPAKLVSVLHFCPSMREMIYKYPYDSNIFNMKENAIRILKSIAYKWPFNKITLKDVRYHYRKMYFESDRVVLLSKNFFPEYKRLGGLKDFHKLTAINNMLSFPLIKKNEDKVKEKRILFCARMTEQKRPERALYLWSRLQDRLTEWSIDFVGDGPLLSRLVSLSGKLNLKNINFHGFVEPIPYYQQSRIFLMTSDYEGWGLTLTEAMQNRCVPVAMNMYASLSDIIDNGKNGFLITENDCDAMADKVYELASDESFLNNMSEAAFHKMERFTPEIIVEKWLKLFDDLKKC